MADTDDMNLIRVGVLGRSVDESTTWTTTGPQTNRNALAPMVSGERVITRVINALDSAAAGVSTNVQAFDARFNRVVGEDGGADQAEFDALGKNLIQAIAELKAGGGGSGGGGMPTVPTAKDGNFAKFQTGEVADSGLSASDFLPRGTPGTYTSGTHFEIPGVSLQQFLDAKINGHFFTGSVTIANGSSARGSAVTFRNIYMQNQALNITSDAQFAGTLTLSGISGSVRITGDWGSVDFATTISPQFVSGTVTLTGENPVIRFGAIDCFGCPDVRLDCGWDNEIRVSNRLQLSKSNGFLEGQGNAKHTFNRTNLRTGSRLEIVNTLGLDAVNLGTTVAATDRLGFVLDYRTPERPLETFTRRGSGGNGSDVLAIPIFWINEPNGHLMLKAARPMADRFRINANGHLEYVVEVP